MALFPNTQKLLLGNKTETNLNLYLFNVQRLSMPFGTNTCKKVSKMIKELSKIIDWKDDLLLGLKTSWHFFPT